ncbi:hypothetical protein I551_0988 [Mycobacterium ulcerans str. Harvey]|uniref:Uncharacterized protein n=1 Tax=Mycobacterium ulcerans str. Harvey TaxID=1299332 RepID=A0ABP3AN68_MYCUL|nr:hypothetical protein I551_0988 [Mycobacterium ulcerans str. Harvey]
MGTSLNPPAAPPDRPRLPQVGPADNSRCGSGQSRIEYPADSCGSV